MKRRSNGLAIFGIILVLLVIIGGASYFIYNNMQKADVSADTEKYINVPTYGYLSCEESQNSVSVPQNIYQMYSSAAITCQSGGDTLVEQCDVTIKAPSCSECGSAQECAIIWSKCTSGTTCNINGGDVANDIIRVKTYWLCQSANENKESSIHLGINQFIYTEAKKGSFWNSQDSLLANIGRYQIQYKPYFIYRYDVFDWENGAIITNTRDCANGGTVGELNLAIESVSGGGKLTQQLEPAQSTSGSYLRARGARIPFISKFVPIVPQYNIFQDGAFEYYCTNRAVYRVEEIETPGGIYKVADTQTNAQVKTVECCTKGDCDTNEYCKPSTMTCEPLGNNYCDALTPCPIVGYQPTADKRVIWQECINKVCTMKEKTVLCNFASDCPGGYCEVDNANPSNNKCKYINITEHCGNGACEASYGENVQSCPKDCSPVCPDGYVWVEKETCNFWCKLGLADPEVEGYCKEETNWLLYILIGAGVLVLIVFILTLPKIINKQPTTIIKRVYSRRRPARRRRR